jgi:hypothetical protein
MTHKLCAGRRTLAALAAVASLTLAGCGGGSGKSHTSTAKPSSRSASATTSSASTTSSSTTASSSAAASTSSSASTGSPGAGASGAAAPGASYALGQTAVVNFQSTKANGKPGPTARLQLTVGSMTKGTLADFKGIQLDADEKASTPVYVKVKLKNLGPGPTNTDEDDPAVSVQGIDDTGEAQDSVVFYGDFPRCPDTATPQPFKVGESVSTCLTFLVPGGIKKVGFTGTDAYISNPVTWK